LLKPQPPIEFIPLRRSSRDNASTLTVNTSARLQTILGFGGALTESSASVFAKLTPDVQERFLEAYYGPTGHRYTLARTHIASCDFSLGFYSYHDVKDDFAMSAFNMSHDYELLIPFIKRVKAKVDATQAALGGAPFRLVSSPWSPPKWLKTCQDYTCTISCGLRDEEADQPFRTAYATYLSKYLSEMAGAGVKPWAITPQNEPAACKSLMESTSFTKESERDFIGGQLGPTLRRDHPDVKLLAFDHNKDHVATWASAILGKGASSASFTDGVAFHWRARAALTASPVRTEGAWGHAPSSRGRYASHDYFGHLQAVHDAFPDALLLATEATEAKDEGHYLHNQSWAKGEHYGHVILGDINHWAQGWIDWNVLLDREGGPTHPGPKECEGVVKCGDDAMMIADTAFREAGPAGRFVPQVFYFYMGHFSRFVPAGASRVALRNPLDKSGNGGDAKGKADGSLEAIATLSADGERVSVVVMNRNDAPIAFTLEDAATGRAAALTVNAHAIHTYQYPAAASA
jgi:glucosylceramidase